MRKNNKQPIDELLFKPLILEAEEGERLIIIFSSVTTTLQNINLKGKRSKNSVQLIKLLDLSTTIAQRMPIVETHHITNMKLFKSVLKPAEISDDVYNKIVFATTLMMTQLNVLNQEMADLANAITAMHSVSKAIEYVGLEVDDDFIEEDEQGSLTLGGSTAPLAQVVFKSITGNEIDLEQMLTRDDVEKIGHVLMDIILNHINQDLENDDSVGKLKAEIEYKIIDALPNGLKADDVHINIDAILDEIRRFKGRGESSEEIGDQE